MACTQCGRELERAEVSLSLEHMDKGYVDTRKQVRDTSTGMAWIGNSRGGNRPIGDRQQIYKVRFSFISVATPTL